MSLANLSQILRQESGFGRVVERAVARLSATEPGQSDSPAQADQDKTDRTAKTGSSQTDRLAISAVAGIWPALLAAMVQAPNKAGGPPVVAVTGSTTAAEELAKAAAAFIPADTIAVLPAPETLPHERLSPRPDTLARRMAVFRRLAHPDKSGPHGPISLLCTPIRSILQPVISQLGEVPVVRLQTGQQAQLGQIADQLGRAAYNRVDMVTRRGEYAVRGGILDVFAPNEDHPIRIDFWGDEVESIRFFAVASQRSSDPAPDGLWAPACRELLLTSDVRQRAKDLASQLPGLEDMATRISQGLAVEGMEALTPLLVEQMVPVVDQLPPGALLVLVEPERLRRRAEDLAATDAEFLAAAWEAAALGGSRPSAGSHAVDAGQLGADRPASTGTFWDMDQLQAHATAAGHSWWTLGSFGLPTQGEVVGEDGDTASARMPDAAAQVEFVEVAAGVAPGFQERLGQAIDQLKQWVHQGWRVVLTTEGHGPAKRLVERLSGEDVPARLVEAIGPKVEPGLVHVTTAAGAGYVIDSLKLAVICERDLAGRAGPTTRYMRKLPARRRAGVDPLQLRAGDLVVHERHGVGRFVELISRTVGSGATKATREYLVMEYAASRRGQGPDRLYVPTDSLDQVTKYMGGENPALSKLGGADWSATKARARRAVQDMAGELIRLYAKRMATKGFAFSPDTPWQRELEDAFAYVETPDQLGSIDEVKGDMERLAPMDRLICGDVGYGKTEIAVRAAFKAVQDSKQVAVLAPTTLLVRQHLETFADRLAPFPVTVKPLSRFQSEREAEQTKTELAQGQVDVVIGTHALLTGTVRFKDLGLVIVDEEQRFGVEHKETLKAQWPTVDVLSMSATPIPRTLEMAVSGIREMSTLATPPEERQPVLTFVGPATPGQTAAAIRRELLRDGQVFYVHNRVRSINKVAAQVSQLVPEARVAVAHGQMSENQLEQVIIDFWDKKIDLLVCTTIIETGLDIANANTLIVDGASKFGLPQLHQLRGRVGRGRERAYAYFLYPAGETLTETAHDRLTTIATQSELGAGMQVAMKDLEIRGAGNLLGGEQSGHIAGVGFDLYLRMISEAVAASKGEAQPAAEVTVELPVDAHIPQDYIDHDRLRLEAYTKIAAASNQRDLDEVQSELADRYGTPPAPTEALFDVTRLRWAARAAGISEISAQGRYIRLHPLELPESKQLRLSRICKGTVIKPALRTVLVALPRPAQLGQAAAVGPDLVRWLTDLVQDLVTETEPN
ncbi:MAG: transcription-repair coupling factor [Micrococcales bacterium]|nr:transcription-repair coupling factor [Micrococcales bacterium]